MNSIRISCLSCVSALAMTSAVAVTAVQAADCSGYDVLVTHTAETIKVAENHSLLVVRQSSIVITNDPKSIYNETTGECAGTILFTPDGKVEMSGHCARKDRDGDTYSIRWAQAAGADKGTWSTTGGTGKFDGLDNGGWFQGSVEDGIMSTTVWGGNCN